VANSIIDAVRIYTKSTPERLEAMAAALSEIDGRGIAGDVVEIGAWRGGNIMLARMMCPRRVCWLYDTFDGMTMPDAELDVKRSGERAIDRYNAKLANGGKWNAISLDDVLQGFIALGISVDRIHFVSGKVEDTLRTVTPLQIAILRLDVDWYHPTKAALEKLYPRVMPQGFLIVDDYGHWMGCQKAVDEYFGDTVPPFVDADYTCRVFRKC
jgi:O-methyltransferase